MYGILPCQGASNTGVMSSKATIHFAKKKEASFVCPLGLPLGVEGIINNCKKNDKHIAINGCGVRCASKALESAGVKDYIEFDLTKDFGIKKSKDYDDENGLSELIEKLDQILHQDE